MLGALGGAICGDNKKKFPKANVVDNVIVGRDGMQAGELVYYHGPNKQCMMFTSKDIYLTSLGTASTNDLRKSIDIIQKQNKSPCPLSHNEYYTEYPYFYSLLTL